MKPNESNFFFLSFHFMSGAAIVAPCTSYQKTWLHHCSSFWVFRLKIFVPIWYLQYMLHALPVSPSGVTLMTFGKEYKF
jgi:hypothetical protein